VRQTTLYKLLDKGKAVVFFFPKAFTPGCTKEVGGFRRDYEKYTKAGAEVIGVSSDTQETNDRFAASLDAPYPIVGDPSGEILKAYKVRWPVIGLARRVTYVIGPDRRVEHAFESQFDAEAHIARSCALVTGK